MNKTKIHVTSGKILRQQIYADGQFLLVLAAPQVAQMAKPGNFVYIRCAPFQRMRRPISIMWADKMQGTIEIFYRALGEGTQALSQRCPGEEVELMGPLGTPFSGHTVETIPLLLGGGLGIPPVMFLARYLRHCHPDTQPLLLMGSEIAFAFQAIPSRTLISGMPPVVTATSPLCEELGIAARLASNSKQQQGVFSGYVTDLARHWLDSLDIAARRRVILYACGPIAMLAAATRLAREFSVPCQVSVEEFMACAVGGCAGCTIPVKTSNGMTMQRVCVEGPVFDGYQVFP